VAFNLITVLVVKSVVFDVVVATGMVNAMFCFGVTQHKGIMVVMVNRLA
jgi:hypothetical protein